MKISTALISGLLLPLCLGTVGCSTPGMEIDPFGPGSRIKVRVPMGEYEMTFTTVTAPSGGSVKQQGDTKTETNAPVSAEGTLNSEGTLMTGTIEGDDSQTYAGSLSLLPDENGEYDAWIEI